MKLAITDACIFIDLYDLQVTSHFFSLDIEVHTSVDVFNEINNPQKQILSAYRLVDKLIVHNMDEADRNKIMSTSYPKSLSESDKSVIYLAAKLNALVLSSDKAVRNTAKKLAIECHGMLWIIDQLVEKEIITKADASGKLHLLISHNKMYTFNVELNHEVNKRINVWSK